MVFETSMWLIELPALFCATSTTDSLSSCPGPSTSQRSSSLEHRSHCSRPFVLSLLTTFISLRLWYLQWHWKWSVNLSSHQSWRLRSAESLPRKWWLALLLVWRNKCGAKLNFNGLCIPSERCNPLFDDCNVVCCSCWFMVCIAWQAKGCWDWEGSGVVLIKF